MSNVSARPLSPDGIEVAEIHFEAKSRKRSLARTGDSPPITTGFVFKTPGPLKKMKKVDAVSNPSMLKTEPIKKQAEAIISDSPASPDPEAIIPDSPQSPEPELIMKQTADNIPDLPKSPDPELIMKQTEDNVGDLSKSPNSSVKPTMIIESEGKSIESGVEVKRKMNAASCQDSGISKTRPINVVPPTLSQMHGPISTTRPDNDAAVSVFVPQVWRDNFSEVYLGKIIRAVINKQTEAGVYLKLAGVKAKLRICPHGNVLFEPYYRRV